MMDSQEGNMQRASAKLEQIISHFYSKSLHIIVGSRVPSIYSLGRTGGGLPQSSRAKKNDKWFHLLLCDRPASLDNLNYWHRNLMDPMIIDIVLVRGGAGSSTKTVLERWVVRYDLLAPRTGDNTSDCKKVYQKLIVLFRLLYSQMRLLPVNRIFRRLTTFFHAFNFDLTYEVSSLSDPFSRADDEMMEEYNFTPVEAFPGRLCISVTYRTTLSDLNLEFSTPLSPKLMEDYVRSSSNSPPISFSSGRKGVCDDSFPLRGLRSIPSVAVEHLHKWTRDFPTDSFGNKIPSYPNLTRRRSTSYNQYRPASALFSPSPSPSHSLSPSSFYIDNTIQTQFTSGMGKGSRNCSPSFSDSSGNSLPLLSPRRTKDDNSLQKSTSGNRSSKEIEANRAGVDLQSRTVNYGVQKIVRDNKDDSGRFSGLSSSCSSLRIGISRSSSKSSFSDDFDDWDFSYPFDIDDVDILGVQRSQNVDDKNGSEITSKEPPRVRKSQDAAIGVLVHMLRAAPPLQRDPICVPSHSLQNETEEEFAPASSGVSLLRKTDDALEELRSYRKMRDLLLSKSRYEA